MIIFPSVILLLLSGESTAAEVQCRSRNDLFPKSGTGCRGYFRCTDWVPVELTCPDEQHFDPYLKYCNWKEFYPCIEVVPDVKCPSPNGLFPEKSSNCKSFYRCIDNKPYKRHCPDDQLFNPEAEKCEWPELYSCLDGDDEITKTNPEASTEVSLSDLQTIPESTKNITDLHTTDEPDVHITEYLTTVESKETKSNTIFEDDTSATKRTSAITKSVATSSTETNSKEATEDVITSTESESTSLRGVTDNISVTTNKHIVTSRPEDLICPSVNGLFPHPTNKHKFISCVNFIPYEMDCPHDLVYEPILEACIWQ